MASPSGYLGSVELWPIAWAPYGWALCNGALLPISSYTALFSLIGTYFGGDGIQTFQLPNMQSRVPIGIGQGIGLSLYVLGETGGTEYVNLLYNNMPAHSHSVNCDTASTGRGLQLSPVNHLPATVPTGGHGIYGPTQGGTMSPAMIGTAGGNQPFPILPPYLGMNYIIALNGVFPSRS